VWLDFICFYVGEEIELMFEFCFSLKINIITGPYIFVQFNTL